MYGSIAATSLLNICYVILTSNIFILSNKTMEIYFIYTKKISSFFCAGTQLSAPDVIAIIRAAGNIPAILIKNK
jgi:hypothetical protein